MENSKSGVKPPTAPRAKPQPSLPVKAAADTARYEALAREHGADLNEEGFNEALKKVGKRST